MGKPGNEAPRAPRLEGSSANRPGAVSALRAEGPSALRRRGRRARTVLALRNRPLGDSGRCGTARGVRAASADRALGSVGGRNPKKNSNVILRERSESKDLVATTQGRGTQLLALVLSVLLAVTMLPAAGLQASSAHADEPAAQRPQTSGGDMALEGAGALAITDGAEFAFEGLIYRVTDGAAALVGFEDGSALAGAVVVPEAVEGAAVAAVDLAEGQVAEGVTSLTLPQTVESVETRGLASALPNLASIEVAGSEGAYSSAAGMLFRQERGEASSDGSTALLSNAELVWAPPAMVVARIPIECRAVAEGAFADASALETVMAFGVMESIAEGAFAEGQVNRVTIVVPITNYASAAEGSERVSGSVQLSEGIPTSDKKRPWFDHGFDSDHIVSGAPFGEIDGVVAVSEEGVAEERSLVTPLENGRSHLDLTPEEQAEKAERRGVDPDHGLSFSYQASMDLSVRWSGDATATPAHLELPAYATIDGVKYQVTAIEPNGFEGAVFLESLVIPEGITTIGESAFAGCANLKEVELPSTLRTIDYAAFEGTALESVSVPEGCTYVGGGAFSGCSSLEDAYVGASTLVGADAFSGSPAEAYVRAMAPQAASGEASQSDGQQAASDQAEPAVASDDGITAYAVPSGVSRFEPGYYDQIPSDNTQGHRPGFMTSDAYTIYYLERNHVVKSDTCEATLCDPSDTFLHGTVKNSSDTLNWGWFHANCGAADASTANYRPAHGWSAQRMTSDGTTNVTTINGKRCLYLARGVDKVDGSCTHICFLAIPKEGKYLTQVGFYYGSLSGVFNRAFDPYGYFAATYADENNVLTVNAASDDLSLTSLEGNSGTWNASGDKAKAEDKFTVTPKPGYTLGNVTVTGEGTTYDAATNTLTMGWADSTVSAELIPNDIKVTFNLPHAAVTGKSIGAYGADNVTWGEGDAADTLTIGTEATKDNTNGTTPMPNTTTVVVSGQQAAFKTGTGTDGYRVVITPDNGWEHRGAWSLSYLADDGVTWVDDPSFTSTQSAVIDYTKEWRLTPIVTGVTYTISYDGNGSGNAVAGGSYQVGNGLSSTPTPKRNGFWFAGWAWANDPDKMITDASDTAGFKADSWYPGDGVDPDVPSFTVSDSAYGNAELRAIWKPKTYLIRYNVEATAKDDGSHWVDTPEDDVFVHPDARDDIASASNVGADDERWAFTKSPEDFRTQDGIDTSALFVDGSYDEGAVNYRLPEVPFEGYLYKGWTKQANLPAGLAVENPNDGPYLAFSADVAQKLWPNQWNEQATEPEGTYVESSNAATLYGVWLRKGVVTVNLESSDPAEVTSGQVNDGASVKVNGTNVESTHVQPIAYWQDRGLMLYREMGEPGHTITGIHDPLTSDMAIADTRQVNSTTKNRDFQAPTRTGFRFLGWGKGGELYIKYFENAEGTDASGHDRGFYLTPAGMDRVLRWDTNGGDTVADEGQQETWEALWDIRTYEIELHVPASTVKNTNGNGWSEAGYRWEQDVQTPEGGTATVSSWRKAKKEWKYWDVFYVPYYDLNSPFNTYRGWFRGTIGANGQFEFADDDTFTTEDGQTLRKPVITEAQGQAQASGSLATSGDSVFRVTAAALGPEKVWENGQPGQETDLDNVTAPDGSIELWLYTEPVYINVTAPMGVFLANDEPYVVGSDPRMALEQEATFTVKESNQDLVLTSITATDIVEADVNQTTNQVDVKTTVDDSVETDGTTAISRASGMCYRMFDVKNDVAVDPGNPGDQTKWNLDNSRIFWVSPDATVYPYVKETNQDPGQHDMGKRVYFGFGGGKNAANAINDNYVEDDPDDSADGNKLAAFKLKQGYGGDGSSALKGQDGYKVATDADGVSYVFDAGKNQYYRTTGEGDEAKTVWYTWAAKPDDANGRLILTEVGSGADGQPARTKDVSKPLTWRDYSFYYGLDLDKCSFDLGAIQSMVESDSAWNYNMGYKKPLVKLMFTFAVERVPSVSYGTVGLSSYGADAAEASAGALSTRQGTSGGDVDAAELVSVGPAKEA